MRAPESLSDLGPEERLAILGSVDDLCRRAIDPLVERPELAVPEAALQTLCASARHTGLLPHESEAGFGLWEAGDGASLSMEILQRIAYSSPGVAYRFHRLALNNRACRHLGLDPAETLVAWEGTGGLGKGALAAMFHGDSPDPAILHDVFPRAGAPFHVYGGQPWGRLAVPVWDDALAWQVFEALDASPQRLAAVHGLHEAPVDEILLSPSATGVPVAQTDATALLVDLLSLHGLGAMAIALGSVESALTRAREYAGVRRQGGKFLHQHAAVRLMLAEAASAVEAVSSMLEPIRTEHVNAVFFSRILNLRMVAHPLLCTAANQCLQVFGGYGYMQDYGMEKTVRDCNMLRLVGGTPTEWKLHVARAQVNT